MPKPIKRRELIRRLQLLGWAGPESGGSHSFMRKEGRRVIVPNPHGTDLDWTLVKRILSQARISREEWDRVSE
jgi:predicted RNA binding protein YcfA (HicA-like mRNA interferase family)